MKSTFDLFVLLLYEHVVIKLPKSHQTNFYSILCNTVIYSVYTKHLQCNLHQIHKLFCQLGQE